MLHVLLQRRHELEKTRNAWAVACKNQNDFEIEYEDYDIPSASEDSGSSGDSVSDGWADHSSEDKDDDEDEEDEDQCEDTSKSSAAKNVQRKRPRCRCPLKGSKAEVIDIPRHLREVHDWRKDNAKNATARYGVRKSFEQKPEKKESDSSHGNKEIH